MDRDAYIAQTKQIVGAWLFGVMLGLSFLHLRNMLFNML